ncbi:F0F1 ATP synthase subunit epsilon [Methylococcus sp. EFPC2]|uniref:F0F1 ATP synthase subunit epsilon n=1 Tax=Methylococcus sp. EFPC2 TaxID=2812648 RepID=UPI0019683E69|nr:F0F1 ATP synthase subunit epsilon [Methylococcus sp. EFPC2]QSA98702.1 F0F1 ATP synthase subunit epsilon [Methylococcus sp. EFPC2]
MKTFTLQLRDATHAETVADVEAFVGQDASGSFSIWAGHARFLTVLVFGLARYRRVDGLWHYLAVPGAVVYFCDNALRLDTRRYLIDDDYERVSRRLTDELLAEERQLETMKAHLRRMEDEFLKRLWQIGQQGRGL